MPLARHSREGGNPSRLRAWLIRSRDPRLRGDDGRGWAEGKGRRARRKRSEDGFTLVELMVVIVIIGLLATVVIVNVVPALDTASSTKAKADVEMIDQGVQRYYLDNRRYPTTEEGLAALQPYLRRVPNDPWNRAYRYQAPGRNGRPYSIVSWGADGREGGSGKDADISAN
jgi:general secretion pathway protein G